MPGRSPAASPPRSAALDMRVPPLRGRQEDFDREPTEDRSNCSSGDADGKVSPSAGRAGDLTRQPSDELEQSHGPLAKRRLDSRGTSQAGSEGEHDQTPSQRRRLARREETGLECLAEASAFQDELQRMQQENRELRAYSGYLQDEHRALAGQVQGWRAKCSGLEAEVGILFRQLQQLVAVDTAPTMLDATSAAARLRALGPEQPARPAQPRQPPRKLAGAGPPLLPQHSQRPAPAPHRLARQEHQPLRRQEAPARPLPQLTARPAQAVAAGAAQRPASCGAGGTPPTLGGQLQLLRQLLSKAGPQGAAAAWAAVRKTVIQPQTPAGSSRDSHVSSQEQRSLAAPAHARVT